MLNLTIFILQITIYSISVTPTVYKGKDPSFIGLWTRDQRSEAVDAIQNSILGIIAESRHFNMSALTLTRTTTILSRIVKKQIKTKAKMKKHHFEMYK